MVGHSELRSQAERRYPDYLRALIAGTSIFPLHLRLGKTRRATDYPSYQAELDSLRRAAATLGIQIVWESVRDPRFGLHDRPQSASFADEATYVAALEKHTEVAAFREDLATIRATCPQLEPWLCTAVRRIVAYHGRWPQLMRTVAWFVQHPRSDLYLRQLPIAGVDTKFFEKQSAILDDLLAVALPEPCDPITTTAASFAERHGLRREEPLIRLRFLCPDLRLAAGYPIGLDDFSIPVPAFRSLTFASVNVIITENLRNFLALPLLPRTLGVLGSGHAATLLARAPWLAQARIYYWGDIDGHGYLALSRLRASYPHLKSIMMNEATFEAARDFTGPATPIDQVELPALTPAEDAMYQIVRDGSVALEQERVPYEVVLQALQTEIAPLGEIA